MPEGRHTPELRLLANVRGDFAEYEREKILERMARGRMARAKAGHVPPGRRLLGYTYVKHAMKGAHYEIEPEEAAIVRRIFALYVQDGLSQNGIAAQLTREGIPTPGERRPGLARRSAPGVWFQSAVGELLRNTAYDGRLYYGKRARIKGKANPDRKTRWRAVPYEEQVLIPVPRIVEPETFEAAQVLMRRNKQQARRNRKHSYLFTNGRLRCGQCGRAMTGVRDGHGGARYKCGQKAYRDVEGAHTKRSIRAEEVETDAWSLIERVLNKPALIAAELERQQEGAGARHAAIERECQHYVRQLAQYDKDMQKWEKAYLADVIALADFKVKKTDVDARRTALRQELERLDAEQQAVAHAEIKTAALREYCARVRRRLRQATGERKQQVLEALDITVTWRPGERVTVEGTIPMDIDTDAVQ